MTCTREREELRREWKIDEALYVICLLGVPPVHLLVRCKHLFACLNTDDPQARRKYGKSHW